VQKTRKIDVKKRCHPRYVKRVLGARAEKNIRKGTSLNWDLIVRG